MALRPIQGFILLLAFFTAVAPVSATTKVSGSSAEFVTEPKPAGEDRRVKILSEYLDSHSSPLASSANEFVEQADRYEVDWKLVAAISGVESTFGHKIPNSSYNAWGWGVYGTNVIYFTSFAEGIETISRGLRQDYMNRSGAQDVYQIGSIYAASPTWASRVTHLMEKIEAFAFDNPTVSLSLTI